MPPDRPLGMLKPPMSYNEHVLAQFWDYRHRVFTSQDSLFDRQGRTGQRRPPVFLKEAETHNVLVDPRLSMAERDTILRAIPPWKRHRWFRSMKSSQALVQSVFGTLTWRSQNQGRRVEFEA
jgi:hypothetical protein